jgi:hypothetical protein
MERASWWTIRAMLSVIAAFIVGGGLECLFRGGQFIMSWFRSDPNSEDCGRFLVVGSICLIGAMTCFAIGIRMWKITRKVQFTVVDVDWFRDQARRQG